MQNELFGPALPDGFRYGEDLLSLEEERAYATAFAELPFQPFEFHGYLGKRRIVSFGFRYDYSGRQLRESAEMPALLLPLREKASAFAGVSETELQQALVTQYAPGAGIGWHRDKPMFEDVVAFSFLSPCTLRFRKRAGSGWQRASLAVQPRSAYLLRGSARREWEHSVPPADRLRYSVTFRNFGPQP
jgi:alkylated DNA repair dioxygenase AlkB